MRHPEIMKKQSKRYYLDKIREGMLKSYATTPKTVAQLMAEADQFAPLVWRVYAIVNITREDVVQMAEEIVNHKQAGKCTAKPSFWNNIFNKARRIL